MILASRCVGNLQVNCYILASKSGGKAIIIDPGGEEEKITQALKENDLKPAMVINTHGHIDHIGLDDNFHLPIYAHEKEVKMLNDPGLNLSDFLFSPFSIKSKIIPVRDKEHIELEDIDLEVIYTPGHTPGGICLLMCRPRSDIVFSGDSLFHLSIGRTDFEGADEIELIRSIKERLLVLPDETIVYPGHGESTTIGEEKKNNPYLK